MPKNNPLRWVLAFCVAGPGVVAAQKPPLITDRPDFTESPFAVPAGSIQVEVGATRVMDGHLSTTSGPEALIRWSPRIGFELRFEPPAYLRAEPARGFTDAVVGMKVELGQLGEWNVGSIASLGIPTGDSDISAHRVLPRLIVTAGRDVGDAWSLGTQGSVGRPDDGGGLSLASTLVAGRSITERLGAFLEIAVEREPTASVVTLLHTGVTLLVSAAVQLDLHLAHGITGPDPRPSLGLGMSTRFR